MRKIYKLRDREIGMTNQTLQDLSDDKPVYQLLIDNNINLVSGLATNYLNHYTEILLVLEMLVDMPECFEDIRDWRAMSYPAHVKQSGLPNDEIVLKAYEKVDCKRREDLARFSEEANIGIEKLITRAGIAVDLNDKQQLAEIANDAKEFLGPCILKLNSVITPNGNCKGITAFIDTLD